MRWTSSAPRDQPIATSVEAGGPPELTPDIEPTGPLGPAPPRGRYALSPINARRWRNFKANRRGYWSLWIFLVLFVISLFAEFIANDKPIYIHVDGKNYFPVFFTYPDTDFGDDVRHRRRLSRSATCNSIWPNKHAFVIWPPIRFSYGTHQSSPADRRFRRSRRGC